MTNLVIVVALGYMSKMNRAELNNELDLDMPGHKLIFYQYGSGSAEKLVARAKTEHPTRTADIWVGVQGPDVWVSTPSQVGIAEKISVNTGLEAKEVAEIIFKHLGIKTE